MFDDKLVQGCRPCCGGDYYRSSRIDIYYRGSSSRPDSILCPFCYQDSLNSNGCRIKEEEYEMELEEQRRQEEEKKLGVKGKKHKRGKRKNRGKRSQRGKKPDVQENK